MIVAATLVAIQHNAIARQEGGGSTGVGGGGDASERRVDEIRADIMKWIGEGGARGLSLPPEIKYETYLFEMEKVLAPHAVIVSFVSTAQESRTRNPELQVIVNGQPKTCRGFQSKKDRSLHVLCNIERFAGTSEAEQYRLIHHEYAGLAGLERNIGASSDYVISNQLTDYLVPETVLRLSVNKREMPQPKQRVKQSFTLNYPQFEGRMYLARLRSLEDSDSEQCVAQQVQERAERVCAANGYEGLENYNLTETDTSNLNIVTTYDSEKHRYYTGSLYKYTEMPFRFRDCTSAGKFVGNLIETIFLVKTFQALGGGPNNQTFSQVTCYKYVLQ